jgi:VanZ family protein
MHIFRILGWCAVALIAVLSLVPGQARPHLFAIGQYEHFTAYMVASMMFVLGYRRAGKAILVGLLLSGFSGILEILQLWIPGRHAQLIDFEVSSLGACLGVLLILIALPLHHRTD